MTSPAEHYANNIRQAIEAARAAGVNVTLDHDGGWDTTVTLYTSVHRRDEDGYMRVIDGPFTVEEY
jgi:hypothetical protein